METPDKWRILVDYIWEPVVALWRVHNLGFILDESGSNEYLVNHAIWADNVVLFGRSYAMMKIMINEMNEAFAQFKTSKAKRYFIWKPDSLEFLVSGPLRTIVLEILEIE